MQKTNKKTVVLGMSGGVDSAVSLKLLLDQGYNCIPVYMKNWDSTTNFDVLGNPNVNDEVCPQEKDAKDAEAVCNQLGVELIRVDFSKEYWDRVFQYFLYEFKANRTPNPDVLCNNEIKFKAFLEFAETLGADFIAMGHYARTSIVDGKKMLLKGVDLNKDQTYFLAQLTDEQLKKAIFPVGELTKPEVRAIAEKTGLANKAKKDSTGICFIGERNFQSFLANYLKATAGPIKFLDGRIAGTHTGLINYTIGQRKGIGLGKTYEFDGPFYVVGKIPEENTLLVAPESNLEYLYSNNCLIDNLVFRAKKVNGEYSAKFRYRQQDIKVKVEFLENNEAKVYFAKTKAVTPGQFLVIYQGEVCLGAGRIKQVFMDDKLRRY